MKKLLFILFAFAFACSLLADITIADNGKSKYVIIVGDNCRQKEKSLAENLQKTLKEITGVDIAVKKESQVAAATPKISVGDTRLAKKNVSFSADSGYEEMVVKTVGNDLIIVGSSFIGTGFAVYDFLENFCGCRWYDALNVKIPKKQKLTFKKIDYRRQPSFIFRQIFTQTRNWKSLGGDFGLKNKSSNNGTGVSFFGRPRDGHSFYAYCDDWPKDRLYLLSKAPDGRRNAIKGWMGPNCCISHPEVIQRFKDKLRKYIAADRRDYGYKKVPYPRFYAISQNDCNSYFCYCDSCQALVKKHGESGLLLTFINQIANDIVKDHPEIRVHTDAYAFTAPPPISDIKAAPNVTVELCHTVGNYYSAIADDTRTKYPAMVKDWASRTNMLGIWDYWIFYWDAFPAPYHNVHQIKKDLTFYYRNKVRYMHIESEASDEAIFFNLKLWLGHKLLDNINLDDKALIAEYMQDYYGPAAPEMKEFMDYVAKRQQGQFAEVFSRNKFNPESRPWLDEAFYKTVQDIFDRAEKKCKPGSMHLKNVHRERMTVDLSMLYRYNKINAKIPRKVLADRYKAYAYEHVKLRKKESSHAAELLLIDNEYKKHIHADEIAKMKNAKPQEWKIGKEWSLRDMKYDVTGVPSNRKTNARAKYENGILYLRLADNMPTAGLKNGKQIFDGDDWEVFLASDRKGEYIQLLVSPEGKIESIHVKNGSLRYFNLKGFSAKSKVSSHNWTVEMTIPVKNMPIQNIRCGNIIRGTVTTGTAWCPTFESRFGIPKYFGTLTLE